MGASNVPSETPFEHYERLVTLRRHLKGALKCVDVELAQFEGEDTGKVRQKPPCAHDNAIKEN